jgi:FdhD protein
MPRAHSTTAVRLLALGDGNTRARTDELATEEPLEIRVAAGGRTDSVAITMRTPGADFELALGFLYSEGIIAGPADVAEVAYCLPEEDSEQLYNVVTVTLRSGLAADLPHLERHFQTSSACGVCGKASLEQLELRGLAPVTPGPVVPPAVLFALPERLRAAQGLFATTGGLHAAGLFTADGALLALREDVGRHNAVDKLVGWALAAGQLPLSGHILLVSGRASFEIVQKAAAAGLPIVCAVSAPSSLAVATAERFGVTLVGFLREGRANVYCGSARIAGDSTMAPTDTGP